MRTLKFRGQNEAGEWMYFTIEESGIRLTPGTHSRVSQYPGLKDGIGNWMFNEITALKNKTQFTGLCDKRDNEIYAGDITQDEDTIYQIVMMKGDLLRFGAKILRSKCVICRGQTFPLWQYTPEYHTPQSLGNVIGNIYDNPELLQEAGT